MRKRLFLTGPDRSGKSELIHQALGKALGRAGGFVTLREWDSQGNVVGYDLAPADGSGFPGRFLEMRQGTPVPHMEVFSQQGTRLLRQAQHRPFVVLDELGGVELLDDGFLQALVNLLHGDTPCIGVMKGEAPDAIAAGAMGLGVRHELARRVLFDYLEQDSDTLVVHLTGRDDEAARDLVDGWVREYVQRKPRVLTSVPGWAE